ncbi:Peroxidase [Thalictrum thalictroides]|uniref:Peroxidase n=1 Tax=Thalictrum thalictroides TaxID=46969 RepID=A0A7J6WFC8_THATH|nr:Peroxidase [Thalictrum thalictroides]
MACKTSYANFTVAVFCLLFLISPLAFSQQLDYNFYAYTCPYVENIVSHGLWKAIQNETRIAASLLRLHFHDCIVDGCDASILLDDTKNFKGEKNAGPNRGSARGYEVIDDIKAEVEKACPSTVSCADILTLAATQAVYFSGGSYWSVPLGRRDSITASQKAANDQIPSPFESLEDITAKFVSKGLDLNDVVVLSGAHTIGFAQCFTFRRRLFNFGGSGKPDPTLDSSMLKNLQTVCPNGDVKKTNNKIAPLDSQTINKFDNLYYKNVMSNTGLLESDQVLLRDPKSTSMVTYYSMNPSMFSDDFATSMVKMGNIGILTGEEGEIRKNCRFVN